MCSFKNACFFIYKSGFISSLNYKCGVTEQFVYDNIRQYTHTDGFELKDMTLDKLSCSQNLNLTVWRPGKINPKLCTCSGKDALTRQREETPKLASFSQVESQHHWTHNSYTKLAI